MRADVAIAVFAAEFTLTESQHKLIDRHQEIFNRKVGSLDPASTRAMNIYYETMEEVPGVYEVYQLLDQLTDFNLAKFVDRPSI